MAYAKFDGVLGLGPRKSTNSDLFLESLYNAGSISEKIFGIYIDSSASALEIILGGYNKSKVSSRSRVEYIPLYDTDFWSLPITWTTYGSSSSRTNSKRAILDSNTEMILLPQVDFDLIYDKIKINRRCGLTNTGLKGCYCEGAHDFEDLYFHFSGSNSPKMLVAKTAWIIYRNNTSSEDICEFMIGVLDTVFDQPTIVLGTTFMKTYYFIHDIEKEAVGFIKLLNSAVSGTADAVKKVTSIACGNIPFFGFMILLLISILSLEESEEKKMIFK